VLRGGRLAHVHADLGNDHFGGAPVHTRDRVEAIEVTTSAIWALTWSIISSRKSSWARSWPM
jgi:hypothetical protein